MSSGFEEQQVARFEAICRQRGLAMTIQRRLIYETILRQGDHPTADRVYELVRDQIPGLSRTTVYRVLDAFVQVGVVTRVCHPGAAARFDPKVHQHHHLVCTRCNRIIDLESEALDRLEIPPIDVGGFAVSGCHIQVLGVCPACLDGSGAGKSGNGQDSGQS